MKERVTQGDAVYSELTIIELIKIFWQGKLIIVATALIVIVIGIIYALSLPNLFKSEVLLSPTDEARGGGMSQIAGELGGLASLAGLNLNQQGIDKTKIALEILKSREFITNVVDKYDLKAELFAVEKWSPDEGLVFNNEVYDFEQQNWLKNEDSGESLEPRGHRIVQLFNNNLVEIKSGENTGFVTLAVIHQSPVVAKKIAELLVKEINDTMRKRDISEAQRSLQYLNEELQKTPLTDMQQVFYRLIEKQTQTIMLANTRPEYIFQTLDPAVIPEEPYKPNRKIIAILSAFFGGFLGLTVVLGLNRVRNLMNQAT